MSQLPLSAFQTCNLADAASVTLGPLALYAVAVDRLARTQMNECVTEVDAKAAAFEAVAGTVTAAQLPGFILRDNLG